MIFKRHIAGLLLICFSVFLAHNLLPHHHHSEVLHSPITGDCPIEHRDTHEHNHDADAAHDADEHPTHCHAFNEVVFQKQSVPALHSWAAGIQAMIVPGKPLLHQAEQPGTPYNYAVHRAPCITAVYPGSKDLRAPPVLA